MVGDLFEPGLHEFDVTFLQAKYPEGILSALVSEVWGSTSLGFGAVALEEISLIDQGSADARALGPTTGKLVALLGILSGVPTTVHFKITLTQSAYLYISLIEGYSITAGATFVGDRQTTNPYTINPTTHVWRITNSSSVGESPPTPPTPTPSPTPGPDIIECVFPELSLNFIAVMSGLASWLGCMIRNIIVLIKWIIDWMLHFGDHLDAWISRLFGVDPSLPFFDEVLKKLDVWISGKFGVDPEKPFWEELVKKALAWIGGAMDAAAEARMRIRGWK